jgi:hypothetical protein
MICTFVLCFFSLSHLFLRLFIRHNATSIGFVEIIEQTDRQSKTDIKCHINYFFLGLCGGARGIITTRIPLYETDDAIDLAGGVRNFFLCCRCNQSDPVINGPYAARQPAKQAHSLHAARRRQKETTCVDEHMHLY